MVLIVVRVVRVVRVVMAFVPETGYFV